MINVIGGGNSSPGHCTNSLERWYLNAYFINHDPFRKQRTISSLFFKLANDDGWNNSIQYRCGFFFNLSKSQKSYLTLPKWFIAKVIFTDSGFGSGMWQKFTTRNVSIVSFLTAHETWAVSLKKNSLIVESLHIRQMIRQIRN